jgi:NADH:ubiquinone oxidoreductase subunit K
MKRLITLMWVLHVLGILTDDQVLLLFISVCFDAVALMLVSTSTTWKHALVGQSDLCTKRTKLIYQASVF